VSFHNKMRRKLKEFKIKSKQEEEVRDDEQSKDPNRYIGVDKDSNLISFLGYDEREEA
jgi:hypothetical protein